MNILKATTAKTNALLLAFVLVAGIIAAISPSFMVGTAQAQPYYGMDSYDDRKPYESNSYDSTDYGIDKDRKSYDNSYKSQYQSYKPDYKPVKDDSRDKSKDSKVDINKLKCINSNLNINGNNAGNVSIGNKGQGYLGTYSSGDSEGYYNDGYNNNKHNKGFDCVINNNNTNININLGVSGNQTLPPERTITCEDCFTANLNETQLSDLADVLSGSEFRNLEGLCEFLSTNPTFTKAEKFNLVVFVLLAAGISQDTILTIAECLEDLGLITVSPNPFP